MTKRFLHVILVHGTTLAAIAWCLGQSVRDARAVDFVVDFDDPVGTGFFDPVTGPARRQAMQAAVDVWGKLIRPSYIGEEILVSAKFDSFPVGSTTLAAAKPSYLYSDFGSSNPQYLIETNYPKALANHMAGRDLAPERNDIEIRFNMASSFYFGVDGLPPAGQNDFVTTAAHELGHGMGFYDSFRDDGDFGLRGDFSYDDITCGECLPTPYDTFLTLGPLGPTLTSLSSDNRESAVVSTNVFWNGANGVAGGGTAPRINAPTTFNDASSISHLDQSLGTLMVPNIPGVVQSLSPVERGILRDMGWTISVAGSTTNWTGLAADNRSSRPGNWTPSLPLPGDSLGFGAAPQTDVLLDLVLPTLTDITFAADAPTYTLRFERQRNTDLTGAGIVNNSSLPQNIILENGLALSPDQRAATINFRGSASAGNAAYQVLGGGTSFESPPNLPPRYVWGQGASITFDGTANAGNATFKVDGGTGFNAPQATVVFRGSARADRAEFDNFGGLAGFMLPGPPATAAGYSGETRFEGGSWAENARFRNHGQTEHSQGGGGFTTFYDNATAGDATFENFAANVMFGGGYGGATLFYENSTASTGDFTNHGALSSFPAFGMGRTEFFDDSRAGPDSDFTNLGGQGESRPGGVTRFHDRSTAQGATFTNRRSTNPFGGLPGTTEFYDDATSPNAEFELEGGKVAFNDRTTAGNSNFRFVGAAGLPQMVRDSGVDFRGNSRAGEADFTFDTFSGATITFWDHSSADQANFVLPHDGYGYLHFVGDSSASDREYQLGRTNIMNFSHRSTAADANITVHPRASLGFGLQELPTDVATAGNATIRVLGGNLIHPAGIVAFRGASSAGDATIRAEGATEGSPFSGANVLFHDNAHAGSATLTAAGGAAGAAGGKIFFYRGSTGGNARLVTEAGGLIDLADSLTLESGSISGDGTFALRSAMLTTGSLNLDMTVAGQIVDSPTPGSAGGRLTKVGTGTLTLAGTNTYTGLTTVSGGTLSISGSVAGDALVQAGATLAGAGNVFGDVDSEPGSTVTPGASPGILTVGGDFNQQVGGILQMEVGGILPGTQYDVLNVGGDASLAGQIVVEFINGFAPVAGQQFNLIDVGGASLSMPEVLVENLAPGFLFESNFADGLFRFTALNDGVFVDPSLPGDTNSDGVVDLVDLNNVRNNFGAAGTPILGDTNGDDVVDLVDLNAVRNNFGASAGAKAVPEPATALLAACGLLGVIIMLGRRRNDRQSP